MVEVEVFIDTRQEGVAAIKSRRQGTPKQAHFRVRFTAHTHKKYIYRKGVAVLHMQGVLLACGHSYKLLSLTEVVSSIFQG